MSSSRSNKTAAWFDYIYYRSTQQGGLWEAKVLLDSGPEGALEFYGSFLPLQTYRGTEKAHHAKEYLNVFDVLKGPLLSNI